MVLCSEQEYVRFTLLKQKIKYSMSEYTPLNMVINMILYGFMLIYKVLHDRVASLLGMTKSKGRLQKKKVQNFGHCPNRGEGG